MKQDVHRRTAEVGFWLGERYWGRGILSEVLPAVSNWALQQADLVRLEAFVFEWNIASARVLTKAGYQLEARLRRSITKEGRTTDSLLYARVEDRP
jgi:RimJ/RimL family protein N-acetyltransferase